MQIEKHYRFATLIGMYYQVVLGTLSDVFRTKIMELNNTVFINNLKITLQTFNIYPYDMNEMLLIC